MKKKLLVIILSFTLYTLNIFSQAPVITSSSPILAGTVGVAYSDTLKATGLKPITWSLTGLPSWASLTDSIISGIPTATGTTILYVKATNSSGSTGVIPLSLTIVPATVPLIYTQLYAQLSVNLKDFHDTINSMWNGTINKNVLYTGQLSSANCNNGPNLVNASSFTAILAELLKLKAIGVKAISVEVSFPMLYEPFLDGAGAGLQSKFLAFYSKLADTIRAQGFKLIVECQSLDAGSDSLQTNWPTLNSFYAGITDFKSYVSARSSTAATVALTMKPDFLVLQEEPATEQANSGQKTNNITLSTQMLDSSLAAVRKLGIPQMKVGAGFGPWTFNYELFANSFTQTGCGGSQPCINSPLDFMDLHIFPIIEHALDCNDVGGTCPPSDVNFQKNLLNSVAIAKKANIPVTVSQTWLHKTMNSEWAIQRHSPFSIGNVEEAREPYSFWIEQDTAFLNTVYGLANYYGTLFLAPFDSPEYSSYLNWSNSNSILGDCGGIETSCGTLSPSAVFKLENSGALDSLKMAVYTPPAHFFHDKIVKPKDLIAPVTPTNLMVHLSKYPKIDTVNWTAGTDNIGVAGYHIWRSQGTDTIQLHDIFQSPFIDEGLTVGYTYCYQVQAFDLAGNVSGKENSCVFTGINNLSTENQISIFPNPFIFSSTFQVSPSVNNADLDIYNLYGQKVRQITNISGQTFTLNRDNLPSGLYFIRLILDNKTIAMDKFVIMDY